MKASRRKPGVVYINDHPLYSIWNMMKQRCYNSKHTAYPLYGGRGIRVCKRWLDSFQNFINDVGERPSLKHTIDRYPDKDGDYEPTNFRWATWHEQNLNRRPRGSGKKDLGVLT